MDGNYIPLYRKYRPQTLDALVGQEHIKKTLTSAIELGKVAHAYLFTGPRGTGKTSTARILAKSLNCKNGPTIHPCGECESCLDITNTIPIDVIEIDAASNRKVEDTQNILEKIQYVPVHGKYKIYIIDEVHMLTNHAFNALLKTLEEPPENVIFILATTEVHKVLDTIKSRCQRYDFRRITTEDIVKHLKFISEKEHINISDDALYTIAKNSAGGMRDSISLLDQLSLLSISKEVTSDDVNAILGRISFDILYELSEKIISSSPNDAIEVINKIYNSGNEPLQILSNLSEYFKNLLITKNCSENLLIELTGLNASQLDDLKKQKDKLETHQIIFILEKITYYIKEIKLANNQQLWLEIATIDLANMTENSKLIDLQNRITALENGNHISAPVKTTSVVTKPSQMIKSSEQAVRTTPAVSKQSDTTPTQQKEVEVQQNAPTDDNNIKSRWEILLSNIKSPSTKALLNLATPVKITAEEVIITFKNDKSVSQMTSGGKKEIIVSAVDAMFNQKNSKVVIRLPLPNDEKVEQNTNSEKISINNNDSDNLDNDTEDIVIKNDNNDKLLASDDTEKIHRETDQEKMILDLFDGKYIE